MQHRTQTIKFQCGPIKEVGSTGADALFGGDGADSLSGDLSNDTLLCGTVADILYSDDGADSMDGGDENAIALTKLEETLMQHQRTRNRLMHGALSALHQ